MKTTPPAPASYGSHRPSQPVPVKKQSGLVLLFLVVALVAGGLAWWEHTRVSDLEAQLAAKQQPEPRAPAPTRVAVNPASLAVVEPQALPPLPAPEEEPEPPVDPRQRVLGALLNNPQIQQLAQGVAQTVVSSAYDPLIQQLQLNPQQTAELNSLISQRALIGGDVLREALAQGVDVQANRAQLQQQVREAQSQVDQQIHGMLGDSNYQQYQDYTATLRQNGRNAGLGGQGGF